MGGWDATVAGLICLTGSDWGLSWDGGWVGMGLGFTCGAGTGLGVSLFIITGFGCELT